MWRMLFAMVASIALLGVMSALKLDGQPMIERSDCYERSAIGQRLGPKSVYRTFDYRTVEECKKACTKEKEACKSFSFGISPKGNGTCELGTEIVKETADLKPIGAINDTEFALYTKKLGCSLVIDKTPYQKPTPQPADRNLQPSTPQPDRLGAISSDQHADGTGYDHDKQQPPYAPDYHYNPPKSGEEMHHVGSELIAVASGVDTYLHPVHDIILSKSRCGVCGENHVQSESHSHSAFNNYNYHPPDHGLWYEDKPGILFHNDRPYDAPTKPDLSSDGEFHRPYDRYDYWPERKPSHSLPAYGSLIPHPDEYYGAPPEHNYLIRPPDTDRYADYPSYKPSNRPEDYYYYEPPQLDKPNGYHYDLPQKHLPPTFYDDKRPLIPTSPPRDKPVEQPLPPPVNPEVTTPAPQRPIEGDRNSDKRLEGEHNKDSNCKGCLLGVGNGKPIITHTVGKHGQQITSIITEIASRGNVFDHWRYKLFSRRSRSIS